MVDGHYMVICTRFAPRTDFRIFREWVTRREKVGVQFFFRAALDRRRSVPPHSQFARLHKELWIILGEIAMKLHIWWFSEPMWAQPRKFWGYYAFGVSGRAILKKSGGQFFGRCSPTPGVAPQQSHPGPRNSVYSSRICACLQLETKNHTINKIKCSLKNCCWYLYFVRWTRNTDTAWCM